MKSSLVIPVKSFTNSKSRLRGFIEEEKRISIVKSGFIHLCGIATDSEYIHEVIVVSDESKVESICSQWGFKFVFSQSKLNDSVDEAISSIEPNTEAVIIAHSDLIALRSFDALLENLLGLDALLCTDIKRQGTNILAHLREIQFEYSFGDSSLASHTNFLLENNFSFQIQNNWDTSLDIDTTKELSLYEEIIKKSRPKATLK